MDAFVLSELESLSRIIDLIYEGAVDPFSWNRIIVALAEYMQSSKAMLFTPTQFVGDGGFYFNVDIPESAMDLWRSKYQPHDLWLGKALQTNAMVEGNSFIGEELVPREELTNSVWYQEFLSQIGIGQVLSNVVFGVGSKQPAMTALSFFRSIDEKPYEPYDKFKASLILPHVSKLLGVMARLGNAECQMATTLTALDRINQGILLLDDKGYVTFANHAATNMLAKNEGLSLRPISGLADKSALFATKSNDVERYAHLAPDHLANAASRIESVFV